jgi:hypothetical protein
VALRIAFDLDGVLADLESEMVRQTETLFGEHMAQRLRARATRPTELGLAASAPSPDRADDGPVQEVRAVDVASDTEPVARLRMTARQESRLWRQVESIDGFWESLREIEPGAVERLATLATDRRWEMIFLTKRPDCVGATAQVQSQRWLDAHGFPLPSVYVVHGSRGRVAAALALDVVVDDRPENCLDVVVDSRARAILVWREDEQLLPAAARRLGIGVVKSVAECLDILTQIDSTPGERTGVMDRVMRLLGVKNGSTAE